MEYEAHFGRTGVDPGGTQVTIDGDRCRPPDAVERPATAAAPSYTGSVPILWPTRSARMKASGASSDIKVPRSPPRAAARTRPRPAGSRRAPPATRPVPARPALCAAPDSPTGLQGIEDDPHDVTRLLGEQHIGLRVNRSGVGKHLGFDHLTWYGACVAGQGTAASRRL